MFEIFLNEEFKKDGAEPQACLMRMWGPGSLGQSREGDLRFGVSHLSPLTIDVKTRVPAGRSLLRKQEPERSPTRRLGLVLYAAHPGGHR